MATRIIGRFESLEPRLCLTTSAAVDAGALVASSGTAEVVEVVAAAILVGTTELSLGKQLDRAERGGRDVEQGRGSDRGLETLALHGRNLGFYYRGFRR